MSPSPQSFFFFKSVSLSIVFIILNTATEFLKPENTGLPQNSLLWLLMSVQWHVVSVNLIHHNVAVGAVGYPTVCKHRGCAGNEWVIYFHFYVTLTNITEVTYFSLWSYRCCWSCWWQMHSRTGVPPRGTLWQMRSSCCCGWLSDSNLQVVIV